jgi:hypothetical protein
MSNNHNPAQLILRVKAGAVVCLAPARPVVGGFTQALAPGDALDPISGSVYRVQDQYDSSANPGTTTPVWTTYPAITKANWQDAIAKGAAAPLLSRTERRRQVQAFCLDGEIVKIYLGVRPDSGSTPGFRELLPGDEFSALCTNDALWAVCEKDSVLRVVESFRS